MAVNAYRQKNTEGLLGHTQGLTDIFVILMNTFEQTLFYLTRGYNGGMKFFCWISTLFFTIPEIFHCSRIRGLFSNFTVIVVKSIITCITYSLCNIAVPMVESPPYK